MERCDEFYYQRKMRIVTTEHVFLASRSPKKNRQSSLDREVYYLDGNREEVVTYAPPPGGATYSKLVSPTLARKRGMSQEEEERFRASLGNLCAALMKASQTSLNKVGEKSIGQAPTQQQVPAAAIANYHVAYSRWDCARRKNIKIHQICMC